VEPDEKSVETKVSAVTLYTGWADTSPAPVWFNRPNINQYWENTVVAIPPNTAGCGADGGMISSGNGVAHVVATTLTCAQTGTSCGTTVVTGMNSLHTMTRAGTTDSFASSDSDVVRTKVGSSKRVLVSRMFRRSPPYRGMVAFFESTDCGANWTEVSTIDPVDYGFADFDGGRLFVDPWSARIFYAVGDNPNWLTRVFISTDGGHNWGFSATLQYGINAYRVTTLPSGRAYFLGTPGDGTAQLYRYDPSLGWSSKMTLPVSPVWELSPDGVRAGNRGLSRVGQLPDGDYLRALYPTQRGASVQQNATVALIKVSGSPSTPTASVVTQTTLSASATQGSIVGGTFVETDRMEMPSAASDNSAMLYWLETNGAPGTSTTQQVKAVMVRDAWHWTPNYDHFDPNDLPAFKGPNWSDYYNLDIFSQQAQGDYIGGAAFYDAGSQSMNFLGQWVDNGMLSTNILRFPQDNLPEEQFGDWASLGPPPGGRSFEQVAISAQASRLDVYGTATDLSIWHITRGSGPPWGGWDTSWQAVPGGTSNYYAPAVVPSTAAQQNLVAVRSDGAMYYARYSAGWSGWTNLGAPPGLSFDSGPAITTWTGGRLDVFARASDGALWHAACGGSDCTSISNWSGWESLGGVLWSGPAAVAWSDGRIDIVAVGTDTSLWHLAYDWCCGWFGWESLGGDFSALGAQPAIASWAPGHLDLFARGRADGVVHHKSWDGTYGWSTWLSTHPMSSTSGVGAASGSATIVDYVVAQDGSAFLANNVR
jgi:hypothetical protein